MTYTEQNKVLNKWDEIKRQMELITAGNKLTEDEKNNILTGYTRVKNYWKLTEIQRFLVNHYVENDLGTLKDCWMN
jgi:hypothetical protein